MRTKTKPFSLAPALTILALSAILVFCIREAHAEEAGPEVRVYHARDKAEQSANDLKLRARGGETVDLKAELFVPEGEDGSGELKPRNSTVKEFRWAVANCGVRAKQQGCKEEELVPQGEALSYKVPGAMHDASVEIVVGHGTELARDALVTIEVSNERERHRTGESSVANPDPKKKGEKDRPAVPAPKDRTRANTAAPDAPARRGNGAGKSEKFGPSLRSRGDSSGGGDTSFGSSSSSSSGNSRSSKSKSKRSDDWSSGRSSFGGGYDDFSYGFGGGGGGVKTNARGFNRSESTTSVVSCTHNAKGRIVCEDPAKKVLRVRAPRPSERKLVKQVPAKTQPAPAKAQSAPEKARVTAPRPARAAPVAPKRLPSDTAAKTR